MAWLIFFRSPQIDPAYCIQLVSLSHEFCCNCFLSILQIDTLVKHQNSKIDLDYMKSFYSRNNETNGTDIAVEMDKVKILQMILSKQLKPERYNGILNLFYIFKIQNPTAKATEITSVLVIWANIYIRNGI